MEKIGDSTDITFIGGAAGDDLKLEATYVYANGRAYANAALLALLRVDRGFDIIKTQSFRNTDKKLIPTKTNESKRQVLEFNNKPAIVAYAEALGVSPDMAAQRFMHNPLGLMSWDDPFVRSPQRVKDGSMVFFCRVNKGIPLTVLEARDMISDTQKALEDKQKKLGSIAGLINFNCILRTQELEQKGLTEQYGLLFNDIPTVGLSTYGEEYLGHINQTATMLIFK